MDAEPPTTGYRLFFIAVQPSTITINIASGGELTVEDIYEEKVVCESKLSYFSSDEDE